GAQAGLHDCGHQLPVAGRARGLRDVVGDVEVRRGSGQGARHQGLGLQGAPVARAQEDRRLPGAALRAHRSAQSLPLPVAHRDRALQGVHRAAADVGGAPAHAAATVRPGDQVARCDQDLPNAAAAGGAGGSGREAATSGIVRRVEPASRRDAQVARALAFLLLAAASTPARAQLARDSVAPVHEIYASCAGDGMPPPPREHLHLKVPYSVQLSALVQAWGAAWTGRDVRQTDLDAVDGDGLYLGVARIGACGMLGTKLGPLMWNVVYEPYSLDEAAHPDAYAWGRFAAAEIGFAPWRWLMISLGIRKIAFGYGHDEPIELRTLPVTPYVTQSVAPDRRAGITLDDDFGAAHVVLGVYEGARDLKVTADGGMLIAARLVAEPIGPVGNTVSTRGDPAEWRSRPRFAVNASILYQYAQGESNFSLAADGALHWGPVGVVGEYVYASGTSVEAPVRHLPFPSLSRQGL